MPTPTPADPIRDRCQIRAVKSMLKATNERPHMTESMKQERSGYQDLDGLGRYVVLLLLNPADAGLGDSLPNETGDNLRRSGAGGSSPCWAASWL